MSARQTKKDLILTYEQTFAARVAAGVIEKPGLSLWMILIPVIFIHFFYRLNTYNQGCKEFAQHFIVTRQRALDEACLSLEAGSKPDIGKLVDLSSAPRESHRAYRAWLQVLIEHYRDLLHSQGDSFEALLRSVYRTRNNYLLFINHLNRVEKEFNAALKPSLGESTAGVNQIVAHIEMRCTELRRADAEKIFS